MITLWVDGLPAPQGSKAFKGFRRGKPVLVESSKAVKPWRIAVKTEAVLKMIDHEPLCGPVDLTITFHLPAPIRMPPARKGYPCVMPDLSKLMRSTEDALTSAGVWHDDGQVVTATIRKRYAKNGRTGAFIMVHACADDAL